MGLCALTPVMYVLVMLSVVMMQHSGAALVFLDLLVMDTSVKVYIVLLKTVPLNLQKYLLGLFKKALQKFVMTFCFINKAIMDSGTVGKAILELELPQPHYEAP